MRGFWSGLLAIVVLALANPVAAQDFFLKDSLYQPDYDDPPVVELRGGFGAIGIEAREYVYNSPGSTDAMSLLVWQSVAPMATAALKFRVFDDWTIEAKGQGAMSGDSYMEDYDWLLPHRIDFASGNWTHQSRHPNTSLDWYLNGSIAVGKDFMFGDGVRANLNGGLRYTDVQWTATGGEYIYSVGGFRDTQGQFGNVPGITYRQQLPALFAGIDAEIREEAWTFATSAQLGMTFFPVATDDHWLRNLRFVDSLRPSPMVALSARGGFAVTDNLEVFTEATLEKVFLARADTKTFAIDTGLPQATFTNSGGGELGTVSLSAGLKAHF